MINNTISLEKTEIEKLKNYLERKNKIAILCHSNPDGDAVGSMVGFHLGLKNLQIDSDMFCIDDIPENFLYLPATLEISRKFVAENYDTVIFVDCGDKKLTRFQDEFPQILTSEMYKINIDHHPTNDNFGDINFVLPQASSTCEIVASILTNLSVEITPPIASALLLGIYTDTGAFMHANTTPQTYMTTSYLLEHGGNISNISRKIFRSHEFKKLKLWGKVLKNLSMTEDGAAIIGVWKKDYESLGASRADLGGIIDLINSMPEAQYSVILSEDEKDNVKASLRTRKKNIDVKAIAEKFGGGGHIKASGFMIPKGKLKKEIKWKIVQE